MINDVSNEGGTDEAGTAGDEDIHSLWKNNPQIRNSFITNTTLRHTK